MSKRSKPQLRHILVVVIRSFVQHLDESLQPSSRVGAKEDEYLTFYSHLGGDSGSTSCISTANHDTTSGVKVPTVSYQSLVAEYGVPEYMKVDFITLMSVTLHTNLGDIKVELACSQGK